MDMKDLAADLGRDVYFEVKTQLGDDWDALTAEEKATLKRTAKNYMELKLKQKLGEDVAETLKVVESSLKDWRTFGEISVDAAFWEGVKKASRLLGQFLAGVAKGLL